MLDVVIAATLVITCGLRARLAFTDDEWSYDGDLVTWMGLRPHGRWRDDQGTPAIDALWHPTCSWSITLEVMHTVQAFQACLMSVRICGNVLTATPKFSRVTQTFLLMTKDIHSELFLLGYALLILCLGFGIGFSVLAPNFQLDHSDGPIHPGFGSDLALDLSAGSALWQSLWAIHGFFDVVELASSPSSALLSPLFLFVYLTVIILPVVNILIAIFTDSYNQAKLGDSGFSLRSIRNVLTFLHMTYAAPAPINLAVLPVDLLWKVLRRIGRLCRCRSKRDSKVMPGGVDYGFGSQLLEGRSLRLMDEKQRLHAMHTTMQMARRTNEDEDAARDIYIEIAAAASSVRENGGGGGGVAGAGGGVDDAKHRLGYDTQGGPSELTRAIEKVVGPKLEEILKALHQLPAAAPAPVPGAPVPGNAKIVASNQIMRGGSPPRATPARSTAQPPLPRIDLHRVAPTIAPANVAIGAPIVSFARREPPSLAKQPS